MDLPATEPLPASPPLVPPGWLRIAAQVAGAVAAAIAVATLVGWVVGMEGSVLLPRAMQQTKPLTGLGCVLVGIGLIVVNAKRRTFRIKRIGIALGVLAAVIGVLVLAVNVLGLDLKVGELFHTTAVSDAADSHPDRSSIAAALGLILSGTALALLGIGGRRAELAAQASALLAGFIGVVVIIGYIFGAERFTRITGDLPFSLDAAIIFTVISLGVFASTPRVGPVEILLARDVGGRMARRLLPVALFAPLILQWLTQEALELRIFSLSFGISLVVTTMIVVFTLVIWGVARNLSRVDRERTRIEEERARLLEAEHLVREEAERLRAEAERRARQEAALRHAAEAIAAAYTVEEVIDEIARHALDATGAAVSFVERIYPERDQMEVVAVTGEGAPAPGTRSRYSGSRAQEVLERNEPLQLNRLDELSAGPLGYLARRCPDCSALLVPLHDAVVPIGVLVMARRGDSEQFDREEVGRANTFATLAALAFRKINLLETSEQRRRELEEVTESRSRLVRGFSHDLKNPLGAADGYAELLEDGVFGPLTERQRESVRRIRGALHSALDLIGDLVELARSESGQLEIEWAATDLTAIAREVAEEHQAEAEAAGLTLELDLPEAIPSLVTDGRRVRQIMGNLLSNAVKYTPPGGRIVVGARDSSVGPDRRPGDWVCLTVRDTGPGIPREKLPILFQEFVRLSEARGGVGLGLAISQRVARLLGGDLAVESEMGVGSTFTLWLPAQVPDSLAVDEAADGGEGIGEGAGDDGEDSGRSRNDSRGKEPIDPRLLDSLVRYLPVGVTFAEAPSGEIIMTNPALETILRHPPIPTRDVAGFARWEGYHLDGRRYRAEEWPLVRALLHGERVSGEEVRYRRGDGTMTWLRVDAAPILDRNGRIIAAVAAFIDIADVKRVTEEQALLADASSILATIQDLPAMIDRLARRVSESAAELCLVYLRDEESHEIRIAAVAHREPAWTETLKILQEMTPGRHLGEIRRLLQAGKPVLIPEVTDEWLRTAAANPEELKLLRELHPVSIAVAPFNVRNRTFGAIAFVRTEPGRHYTKEDLWLVDELARRTALSIDNSRLYAAALAANRAESEFLAVISHELRTPLNAIIGYADLLLLGVPETLGGDALRLVERIMESAAHLREMIDELLTLSRLETGEEVVHLERIDIAELIREVVASTEQAARMKGLVLDLQLPDPEMIYITDREKLARILKSLLSNAVKFTPEGTIGVRAAVEGDQIVIRVSDTGIGIEPREQKRIFEPFWQVDRGTTRRVSGTGLGLGVSHGLAELLDGNLTVESRVGEGSTFTLRIPARN